MASFSESAAERPLRAPAAGRRLRTPPTEGALGAAAMIAVAFVLAASTAGAETPSQASPVAPSSSAASPASAPKTGDLSSLLAGMRSATGVVAHFTETKELALLSAPLEAAGTIYFVPPGRLVRVVTRPGRSRLVVDGDKVRFEDETGSKGMDLSASPIARQLIDSFVVLFNGDEKRLKELYEATFSAEGEKWRLHLVPRSMPLSRMIASFDLTGSGARIDRMEAAEPDGDRTVTVFGETEVQHRFDDKELAELFTAAPAQ